jgi:DNA repair protein RadC
MGRKKSVGVGTEPQPEYSTGRSVMSREEQILLEAEQIMQRRMVRMGESITSPEKLGQAFSEVFRYKTGIADVEHFGILYLDQRHRPITYEVLFTGTIDAAVVYPRLVVAAVIKHNAACVAFAHNHPSGILHVSDADVAITRRLKDALSTIDVRIIDHFIVSGEGTASMVAQGFM